MREAIGGSGLFMILLIFFSVFIGFMSAVIQYSWVYRIKNTVISYIEEQEGIIVDKTTLRDALDNLGYKRAAKICKKDGKNRGVYYSMTFYVRFGILSRYIDIEIAGETRLIDTGNYEETGNWISTPDSVNASLTCDIIEEGTGA